MTGERSHIECRAQRKKKRNRTERSELVAIESAWHNCEQDVKGKVFLRPECLAWSNPFKKNLGTVIGGSVTSKSHWHQGTSCFFAGGVEGQHLRLLLSIHRAEALLCNDENTFGETRSDGDGLVRGFSGHGCRSVHRWGEEWGSEHIPPDTIQKVAHGSVGTALGKKASAMYTLSHTSTHVQTRSCWNEAAFRVALHTSA